MFLAVDGDVEVGGESFVLFCGVIDTIAAAVVGSEGSFGGGKGAYLPPTWSVVVLVGPTASDGVKCLGVLKGLTFCFQFAFVRFLSFVWFPMRWIPQWYYCRILM